MCSHAYSCVGRTYSLSRTDFGYLVPAALRPFRTLAIAATPPESRWGGRLPLPASQCHSGAVTQLELGATEMEITTVGIDLAKNAFQVHAIGEAGEVLA